MTTQLAVRLSEETVKRLDELIRGGSFTNRTEAIRAAIDGLIAEIARGEIERAIVAGYRRTPDAPSDPWLDAATTALVSAEPW